MKKILITATLLFSSSLLFSQTKFGLKGGVNFSNMDMEGGSEFGVSPSSLTSFHAGGFAEVPLNKVFSFQPALLITGKGYDLDFAASIGGYSTKVDQKLSLIYLELPLNLVAKFNAGPGHILFGTGPYAGFGLTGKSKGNLNIDGPGTSEDISTPLNQEIEFGNYEDEIERFDFGVNLLTGYELKSGLIFNLGYGFGLRNISNAPGTNLKNKVLSLSVGYKF